MNDHDDQVGNDEPIEFAGLTRQDLIELIRSEGDGPIRINFAGKKFARSIVRAVMPRVMEPVRGLSVGTPEEQARCQLIEGDNLQAMTTLYRVRGQVDLILTDPPYNTGKDFRYNDRWDQDPNDPGMGELVLDSDGARHTKWMKFMWPRLQMMRSMLKDTGVLAICIDHRELFRLGQMLDELFGEANRIAIINWQKSYAPRNDNKHVSTATEYVLVYAKNLQRAKTGRLKRNDAMDARYWNPDYDPEGPWKRSGDATAPGASTHPGMVYGIQNPFTGIVHYPSSKRCWANERDKMRAWLEEWSGEKYVDLDLEDGSPSPALVLRGAKVSMNEGTWSSPAGSTVVKRSRAHAKLRYDAGKWPWLWFSDGGEGGPGFKRHLSRMQGGIIPMTWWENDEPELPVELNVVAWNHHISGHSQTGINELDSIVGKGHGFETVKPTKLLQKIIQLWCPADGLVLDPFAGSGTTGHAVLAANNEADTTRRFILIEQGRPERGDSYARTLTAERLRRVCSGDWSRGPQPALGGGFTFLELKNRVDAVAVLKMERSEMVETVVFSYFDANRRGRPSLIPADDGHRYLVATNDENEGFFLVWDGPTKNTSLTREVYAAIAKEAKEAGLERAYHVYARQQLYVTASVRFYPIPDRILADFGLDPMSEPFSEEAE